MGKWRKAKYSMEYRENGEKVEHIIYANSLREAKIQAKAIAEKNNVGIMYGLQFLKT